jgi:threonyl-tRNA synthetase
MASELTFTLPDGKNVNYPAGSSALDIATGISEGLARVAIAAKLDGELIDLKTPLTKGGAVELLTDRSGDEALDILRHSTSHLMAHAVKQLWPDTQVAIGPTIETGFYYDFLKAEPFTEDDMAKIEERMKALAKEALPVTREEMPKAAAIAMFKEMGEGFKAELIEEKVATETASLYRQGDFVDLCRGPHVPDTGKIKAFKLLSVAGAYWKGDEKNVQLQRIYGTSYFNKKELKAYLNMIEEAKKRDHRKLGKELDLFSFQEEVGGGLAFWHPKGAMLRHNVEDYLKKKLLDWDYELVITPHIAKADLWHQTGHLDFYKDDMYTMDVDGQEHVIKPMNCPFHILIYKNKLRSYRDLPVRYAEFGTVYRKEMAGALHGLMRVRGFTQDDAHHFCTPEQVVPEVEQLLDRCIEVYNTFGFTEYEVKLSVRDPNNKEKYLGSDEDWEHAEGALKSALEGKGIPFKVDEGEAVFYGPKIDIKLKDTIGRGWQATTIQFDFNLPSRLNINYIGADGKEHKVVMIHRALFGSVERFIGILIEQFAGHFPLWLAPQHAVVLPITDAHKDYAYEVAATLKRAGLRVEVDGRNEKIGYKIREHQMQKMPFQLICGDKEVETDSVAVRNRFDGDLGPMPLEQFVGKALEMIHTKVLRP